MHLIMHSTYSPVPNNLGGGLITLGALGGRNLRIIYKLWWGGGGAHNNFACIGLFCACVCVCKFNTFNM